ncbi:MAG: glycosyltransferase family 4 protein [Deltaproteobacteria bacterium]|nr:glycosyltransferase family 4 protein [Deltaproteobacteria bacterium]
MRVLHVMNGASGGAALSTIALMQALRPHGVSCAVVCHDSGSPDERAQLRDAAEGAALFLPLYLWNRKLRAATWKRPLLELRQLLRTGAMVGSAMRVAAFARTTQATLVHTNTLTTPEGGLAARALGLPHVWHVRELVGPGHPFRLPVEGRTLGRVLALTATRLIANSNASAEALRPWLVSPERLDVVPNGIELDTFSPTPALPAGPLRIGMVGNLSSRTKKHGLLLEAIAALPRTLRPLRVSIYGHEVPGDTYVAGLRARSVELGLEDVLRLPGFDARPAHIMAELDILVHPADNESFGRVVIEAMAASLPVVGVRGGGVGEIVVDGETGLLAPPDDPRALAACIERLSRDPELRRRLGAAGRRRAESLYSLDACVRGVLSSYRRACAA